MEPDWISYAMYGTCPHVPVRLRTTDARGVRDEDFHCARQGMADATPRCTVQCAACAGGVNPSPKGGGDA